MNIIHYIVGRQVGKTTKMLEMLSSSKADINIVVVRNSNMKRFLEDKCRKDYGDTIRFKKDHRIYSEGGNKIVNYSKMCDELVNIRVDNRLSVNIYFDELIGCVETNSQITENIVTNFINKVRDNFDEIHTNVVAFSTPMKMYRLKNYCKWMNGYSVPEKYVFENALLSTDYISEKIPLNGVSDKGNIKALTQAVGSGERLDVIKPQLLGTLLCL